MTESLIMIKSMTGYASTDIESKNKLLHLEIKSVNHRFLDIQCKLPEEFKKFEHLIRQQISQSILRGKIEFKLQYTQKYTSDIELSLNHVIVDKLTSFNKQLLKKHKKLTALSVADILRFPGILEQNGSEDNDLDLIFNASIEQVIQDFNESRLREGEKLKQHLLERLTAMQNIIQGLESIFPQLVQSHLNKVEQKLRTALENIDDERLKQEFALFMQKSDIDEEFSRLKTHISEVNRILNQENSQPKGKRLDFLMQELNREANTLGSKAIALPCTQTSIELKVLIEQMREQIQNIE